MISQDQRGYYCAGVIGEQQKFYEANPAKLYEDVYEIIKAMEDGPKLIHAMNKMLYNGGRTTRFKDDKYGSAKDKMTAYIDKIREGFWDRHKYDIPPSDQPKISYD